MKLKLVLSLLVLGMGIVKSTLSQSTDSGIRCLGTFNNQTNCDLEICFDAMYDCFGDGNYDGEADQVSRHCFTIPAGTSQSICIPLGGCNYVGMSHIGFSTSAGTIFIEGEQLNNVLNVLSGNSNGPVQISIGNEGGPCNILNISRNGNGEIQINPYESCSPYCIKNINFDCPLYLQVTTNCLDNPCTPDIDFFAGGTFSSGIVSIGEQKCVSFGTSPDGCPLCPCDNITLTLCVAQIRPGIPAYCIQISGNNGLGQLECGGITYNFKYELVNGVYEITKL